MSDTHVMIVDDDLDNLAFLSAIIKKTGHETQSFTNGADALAALETKTPILIVLDIQMPHMNGFEVLKAIRDQETLAQVPVVMLSAISAVTGDDYDPDVIESRYGVRPTAFLNKGISPKQVQEQLAEFLDTQAAGNV